MGALVRLTTFMASMFPVKAAVVPAVMQFETELETPSVPLMCPLPSVCNGPPIKIMFGLKACDVPVKLKFPFRGMKGLTVTGGDCMPPPQDIKERSPKEQSSNASLFMDVPHGLARPEKSRTYYVSSQSQPQGERSGSRPRPARMLSCLQVHLKRHFFIRQCIPAVAQQLVSVDLSDCQPFPGKPLRGPGNSLAADSRNRSEARKQQKPLLRKHPQINHRALPHAQPLLRTPGLYHVCVTAHHHAERFRIGS